MRKLPPNYAADLRRKDKYDKILDQIKELLDPARTLDPSPAPPGTRLNENKKKRKRTIAES